MLLKIFLLLQFSSSSISKSTSVLSRQCDKLQGRCVKNICLTFFLLALLLTNTNTSSTTASAKANTQDRSTGNKLMYTNVLKKSDHSKKLWEK